MDRRTALQVIAATPIAVGAAGVAVVLTPVEIKVLSVAHRLKDKVGYLLDENFEADMIAAVHGLADRGLMEPNGYGENSTYWRPSAAGLRVLASQA